MSEPKILTVIYDCGHFITGDADTLPVPELAARYNCPACFGATGLLKPAPAIHPQTPTLRPLLSPDPLRRPQPSPAQEVEVPFCAACLKVDPGLTPWFGLVLCTPCLEEQVALRRAHGTPPGGGLRDPASLAPRVGAQLRSDRRNQTQNEILLKVAAWAKSLKEAQQLLQEGAFEEVAFTAARKQFAEQVTLEKRLLALTDEEITALREGLDMVVVGKAHVAKPLGFCEPCHGRGHSAAGGVCLYCDGDGGVK